MNDSPISNKKTQTIDEYINSFPKKIQERLVKVRQAIQKVAPEAQEEIKWNRPAYSDEKRILVMFAAFENHIGFYITPTTLQEFSNDLTGFKTGKGSIQFPHEQPLQSGLIKKITEYRVWESKEKDIKWKS